MAERNGITAALVTAYTFPAAGRNQRIPGGRKGRQGCG